MGTLFLKRPATILLLLASVLIAGYLALPLWLPSLIRAQLGPDWQLESLEFDYPLGPVLHVESIVLGGNPGGISLRATARDVDIDIYTVSANASSVEVDASFSNPRKEAGFPTPDDFSIPLIFRPEKLLPVSIDSFHLNLRTAGKARNSLLFKNLQIGGDDKTESWIKTELPLPAVSKLAGQIEVRILHDLLEAQLQLHSVDHKKALQIDFRQSGTGKEISSELHGQAQLHALQALLLAAFPEATPLDHLKSIHGLLSFEGHFAGSEKQVLEHAKLSAQNVIIDRETDSTGLNMDLEARREGSWILFNLLGPGTFRFEDNNKRISGMLDKLLPVMQQGSSSVESANDSLLVVIEPDSEIRLQAGARQAAEFRGAASLKLLSDLAGLSLDLAPDARFRLADLLSPKSLSGSGTINIELESGPGLILETTASPEMALGASLQASGWLALDGQAIRFTESTAFRLSIPRLTARVEPDNMAAGKPGGRLDFHDLELAGTVEVSLPVAGPENETKIHYNGTALSKFARISQQEPDQAPRMLAEAKALELELDFSRSGEQWRSSGTGILRGGRMGTAAVSANQLDFEWKKVDPLAATGEFLTRTRGLSFSHEEENYQSMDLDIAYELLPNGQIEGQGDLLFAGEIPIPIRFNGGLDAADWVIDILPSRLSLRQAVSAVEATLGTLPALIEAGGGTIDLQGSFRRGAAVRGDINISGQDLGFSLAESTVEGVDFNIDGAINDSLAGSGWISFERIGLAAGLDLFQTRVKVGLMTPDSIGLEDLRAEFFGGELSADHVGLSPDGLNDTQIKLTGVDLEQVLEYIDIGGLKGTGKLTIVLPTGSQGTSLTIRDGVFRATGPGILSYSESMSETPAQNIGLAALENFHYSELDGTIDYHPDGTYQLMVHLVGSNPDLYDGYPIALNLNLGGMLPEAFEVLFLTGDFDQAILSRIRQENVN